MSPNGRYLLTERLKRPYSYLLPASFFSTEIAVSTIEGTPVKTIVDRPLADDLPVDFDATVKGPREVEWRSDAPSTLAWAEALDGGDPKAKVPFHDRVVMQAAPFDTAPVELAKTVSRYRGTLWGDDGFAMVLDSEWKTRTEHRSAVSPASPGQPRLLLTPQLSRSSRRVVRRCILDLRRFSLPGLASGLVRIGAWCGPGALRPSRRGQTRGAGPNILLIDACDALFPDASLPPMPGGVEYLSDPDRLEQAMTAASFHSVTVEAMTIDFETERALFDAPDVLFGYNPLSTALADAQRDAVMAWLHEHVARQPGDQAISVPSTGLVAVGHR